MRAIVVLALLLVLIGIEQRGLGWDHLVQAVGYCLYRDGACSTAYATWTLVTVSALALVAAVVAGMYAKASADEARVLAQQTAAMAAGTLTLASVLEGILAVTLQRCPTKDPHLTIEPRAVLWLRADGRLLRKEPPDFGTHGTTIFEAKRFDRRGVFNFHVSVQSIRQEDENNERPLCTAIEVALGDIGEDPVHFHIRSAQNIPDAHNVRIVFRNGISLDIDGEPGEPKRMPVKVSQTQQYSLTLGVVDV